MRKVIFVLIVSFFLIFSMSSFSLAETQSFPSDKDPTLLQVPNFPNVHYRIPPKDFDPLKANDSELQRYGFPRKPTDEKQLENWTYAMKHAKMFVEPRFASLNITHKISKSTATGTDSTNRNWSGYLTSASTFNEVSANWNLASVDLSGSTTSYSSTWVGFGGYGNSKLTQAGTESDRVLGSHGYTSNYYFWWEALPDYQTQQVLGLLSYPGDQVYTSIYWDATNGCSQFYLENITQNRTTSFCKGNSNDYYGGQAEWVVERTEVNGTYPHLADFNTVTFTNASAADANTSKTLDNWGSILRLVMKDSLGALLASPGDVSSGTFTDNWSNFGNIDTP